MMFHELDTVAILRDLPEYGLKAGAEGVVLLTHDWAAPQGLTIEFYTGDRDWSIEADEEYSAVTVSLPADQVRLVERHVPQVAGEMRASEVRSPEPPRASLRRSASS